MSTTHHPHPKPHWLMAARMRLFTVLVYPAFFLWMLIGSPFLLLPRRVLTAKGEGRDALMRALAEQRE